MSVAPSASGSEQRGLPALRALAFQMRQTSGLPGTFLLGHEELQSSDCEAKLVYRARLLGSQQPRVEERKVQL